MHKWKETNQEISKTFSFKNFKEAVDFVNQVKEIAESYQHHPDLFIHSYNKVKVTLTTHSKGKVTEKDYEVAQDIDQLV